MVVFAALRQDDWKENLREDELLAVGFLVHPANAYLGEEGVAK